MEEYIFLVVFHFKMKELNWVSERLGKLRSHMWSVQSHSCTNVWVITGSSLPVIPSVSYWIRSLASPKLLITVLQSGGYPWSI